MSGTKPVVLASGSILSTPEEFSPFSITPQIKISSSCLTKLTHQNSERKNELLKTLKDDQNGDFSENRDYDKVEDMEDKSTPEPKES